MLLYAFRPQCFRIFSVLGAFFISSIQFFFPKLVLFIYILVFLSYFRSPMYDGLDILWQLTLDEKDRYRNHINIFGWRLSVATLDNNVQRFYAEI